MRLDKYLANNTSLSRKQVKTVIKHGGVLIDGAHCTNAAQHIDPTSVIELDGEQIEERGPGYFMLNKPEGVVCANSDADYPTVFDFLEEDHPGLHVAGRLDLDTTGLVLITGDGNWSHRLTSPKYKCVKRYRVLAAEFITDKMITKLESGVYIGKEKKRTAPAMTERISDDEIFLMITEGRYHQVKQMFAAVGNAVDSLHRESIGDIELDPDLAPGEYRPLTQAEVASVGKVASQESIEDA